MPTARTAVRVCSSTSRGDKGRFAPWITQLMAARWRVMRCIGFDQGFRDGDLLKMIMITHSHRHRGGGGRRGRWAALARPAARLAPALALVASERLFIASVHAVVWCRRPQPPGVVRNEPFLRTVCLRRIARGGASR